MQFLGDDLLRDNFYRHVLGIIPCMLAAVIINL